MGAKGLRNCALGDADDGAGAASSSSGARPASRHERGRLDESAEGATLQGGR